MVLVHLAGAVGDHPNVLGPFKWVRVVGNTAYGVRPDAKTADVLGAVNPDGTWVVGATTLVPVMRPADRDDLVALYEARRRARLDLWTGRRLTATELPVAERPVGTLTALLRKMTAAARKTDMECDDDED